MIELTKKLIDYLHSQPCFACRYSEVDPFDWGLRCCNSDSEHCTEYCPEICCEHLDIDEELSQRLKSSRVIGEDGKIPRITKLDLDTTGVDSLKYRGDGND